METLLYFALWAGLFFLMMRFGCGAHIMGHGNARRNADGKAGDAGDPELRWVPPSKDTDPVCGKTVATQTAKPSVHAGNVYYFCSRECREAFEAAPDLYVAEPVRNPRELGHSHA